jgi:hypothetical protein
VLLVLAVLSAVLLALREAGDAQAGRSSGCAGGGVVLLPPPCGAALPGLR